jgi:predicted amidohydrolase YtcJ
MGLFAAQRRYAPDVEDHRPLGTSRALTGIDTLTGYTANAARVDSGDGGVLRVGAPADLVAWGDDIVNVAPEDVTDLPVHLTVVAGRSGLGSVHLRDVAEVVEAHLRRAHRAETNLRLTLFGIESPGRSDGPPNESR